MVPGFQRTTHFDGCGNENGKLQRAGTEKKIPVLRNAPIKLKFSGHSSIIGVGTSNPLVEFSISTLICSYSLYKLQIYSSGPHGQPEGCSYQKGSPTLSFSLIEVLSGSTIPKKRAKRNRLTRRTKIKSVGIAAKKKSRQSRAFFFFVLFFKPLFWQFRKKPKTLFFFFFFFFHPQADE